MRIVADMAEYGRLHLKFFTSTISQRAIEAIQGVPERKFTPSVGVELDGRQLFQNARNVDMSGILADLYCAGFRMTKLFQLKWKERGLRLDVEFTHECRGESEIVIPDCVKQVVDELVASTWRYVHVWQGGRDLDLVSIVMIERSKRTSSERNISIQAGELALIETAVRKVRSVSRKSVTTRDPKALKDLRRELAELSGR